MRCTAAHRFLLQHPGVFAAAALAGIHHQRSLSQGDARQSAGHDDDFFAVENVRPQIDAPAFEVVVEQAGMLAEFDDRLGDEVARVGFDLLGEFIALAWSPGGPSACRSRRIRWCF